MSLRSLHTAVYDALCSFPQADQFSSLAHAQVRNQLADHLTGALHHDGWVQRTEEKATDAQSATATPPGPTGRVAQLLDAIRTKRGRWTTVTAFRFYRDHLRDLDNIPNTQLRAIARGDLRDLAAWGHLLRHEEPGRQYYTLKTRKDGRP
jgi:DNA-directed RNA polymerase specialized sigma24 family protein